MTNKSFAIREFNVERRSIPLAIQTYFWRQTSQLLKTKLVKRQYESACIALERVICENRIQDLQPSLASAVKSVPRWYFVHSSVPYVIQCCAALLSNRHQLGYFDRLSNSERELLYTLQWILYEAPAICNIEDPENQLHPMTTIELFVNLLIPHVFKIHENDLTFRLEYGQQLWKPLWSHKLPPLPAFTHHVMYKDPNNPDDMSMTGIMYDGNRNSRSSNTYSRKSGVPDALPFSSATFFDVAVLRCLSSPGWCEEGVYWALQYIIDYLKREFDIPDPLPKATSSMNRSVSCCEEIGVQIQVTSEDQTDVVHAAPPPVESAEVLVECTAAEKIDATEQVVETADDFTEDSSDVKLIEKPDEHRPSVTKLRITVDSPIMRRRSSPTGEASVEGENSSYYRISVTPSPATVELINETDHVKSDLGNTNNGADTESQNGGIEGLGLARYDSSGSLELSIGSGSSIQTGSDGDRLTFSFSSVSQLGSGQIDGTDSNEELIKTKGDRLERVRQLEAQSSISSDTDPQSKPHVQENEVTETGSSDAEKNLLCDSSIVTQETAIQSVEVFQTVEPFIRVSAASIHDSMFTRTEHYLVFPGAADYITTDGRLSVLVILQAVNGVLKENLSARVCGTAVKVLELLTTIHERERSRKRSSTVSTSLPHIDDRTVAETIAVGWKTHQSETVLGRLRTSFYGKTPTINSLATGCGIRLIKALGCPLGCGEGCHAYRGDLLRDQANNYLESLRKQDERLFKAWLLNYSRIEPVEEIVDFLHALLGFCEDGGGFGGDEEGFCMMPAEEEVKKKPEKPNLFANKEGVESIVVDVLLKPLTSRVAEMKLNDLDNLTFYGELRQLLRYIKENYGGAFWKVAMSGLLECAFKGKPVETAEVIQPTPAVTVTSKEPVVATCKAVKKEMSIREKMTPKATRRKFFKGQKTKHEESDIDLRSIHSATSFSSCKVTADGTAVKDTLSPRSKRKNFSLSAWRRKGAIGQTYDSDDEDDPNDPNSQAMSLKRKLFKEKSRKRIEEVFPSAVKNSRKKLCTSSSSSLQESPTIDIVVQEYQRKPVDITALREGLIRLRFLMKGTQPGAVPDPQIVAAMLDLEAPVVARAALLLECAYFVHRCNRGEWPMWLRANQSGFAQKRAKTFSLTTPKRNLEAMHEAGVLFHKWGVALGQKLEMVLKKRKNTAPNLQEEERRSNTRLDLLEEEVDEDFMDEGTLSEASRECPYALKMAACQLLIEITAFLRESHGMYQIRRDSRQMAGRGSRGKSLIGAEKRRSTHFSDQPHNRLSGLFGGGERIRKQSAISQGSVPSDFSSSLSPGRSSPHEPPVIMVQDQEGRAADDSMLLVRRASDAGRVRKLSDCGIGMTTDPLLSPKRSSLYLPKTSVGNASPRLPRQPRHGTTGDKRRTASTRKRPSGPGMSGDFGGSDDESEDEETNRFPWLTAVILLNSSTSYLCDHQSRCPPNCHQRQKRVCSRLVKALEHVYTGQADKSDANKTRGLEKSRSKPGFNLASMHMGSPQHGAGSGDTHGKKDKDDNNMLDFIKHKLCGLTHCAFSLIAKAGTVIEQELLEETLPVAWELLLDEDQQLVSAAAAVFLLSGIRLRSKVEEMLYKELTCSDADDRVNSLLRYEVLWQSRFHAWPRLEERASFVLKVPPPRVDFTLPSPPLGIQTQHVPDCPWDPLLMLEEQPGNRKTKSKGNKKVKEAEEAEAKRILRAQFPLRTVPVSIEATMGSGEEEKTGRRQRRKSTHANWELNVFPRMLEDMTADGESHQVNADMWPAAFSSAVPHIIRLLDDVLVDTNKTAVMTVAYRLVWNSLIEDPVLFFRTILEEVTKKDKQESHICLIKKLFMYIDQLPPASARFLLNNLVGVAMYYARTNKPGAQDSVALVLSLTWELVPSVKGLFLKDIKQCLKKEHCDAAMLIFANVPGAKKLAVTCCNTESMSEKIPVNEEMTFSKVISYLRTRFNLNERDLWLIDTKSKQLLEERDYVRDVFAHRKGFPSPQLSLEHVDPESAFLLRQAQAFTSKLADTGRIAMCLAILKAVPNQKHSSFLHGEFSRQTSFPRKALDSDFALYSGGVKGKELFGMDVIHKIYWVKLVAALFQYTPSDFPWGPADLNLFINVINGAILLHCEDAAMIRLGIASLINIAIHFSHIFAGDGFHFVFPSLLQVYAHHQGNDMVTRAIEFALSQFYALHQKPCLLQLFASVAPILLLETRLEDATELEPDDPTALVPPKCLYTLLASLDKNVPDELDILELVHADKPLKAMDSCYGNEIDAPGESKVDIALRLCVTVVDFAPESKRATQMMVVLSAILPYYLESLSEESENGDMEATKKEAAAISALCTSINVLIKSSDVLTRSFVHFQSFKSMTDRSERQAGHSQWGSTTSLNISRGSVSSYDVAHGEDDDDGDGLHRERPLLERLRAQEAKNEVMEALEQYRKPRNALLVLVADYVSICTRRVEEIRKVLPTRQALPDLLDDISIILLAEIMYSLMKLAVYDPITMNSPGVQRYMLQALPLIDWSPDAVEPAVNLVLKRLSKIFNKLIHKPDLVRNIEWKSLESYVRGIYLVLCRQKFIAKSQYLKALVTTCMSFVLEERPTITISLTAFLPMAPICAPPQYFSDTIIKLASRLMHALNNDFTLKELCGGTTNFGSPLRTEKMFLRVLLPICIRLGSGRADAPKASPDDVAFALKCFLRVITTKNGEYQGAPTTRLSIMLEEESDGPRQLAFDDPFLTGGSKDDIPDSLYQAAYLGMKLLIVCFEDQLATEWHLIFSAIDKVVDNEMCGLAFWDFIDFAISHRSPLYLMLLPLIQIKASVIKHHTHAERTHKLQVIENLARPHHAARCKNAIIQKFMDELTAIKSRRAAKDEDEDLNDDDDMMMLNSPPQPRSSVKSESEVEVVEGEDTGAQPKQPKKMVTFSPHTSFDESSIPPKSPTGSEASWTSQDRRKKWLQHKQPTVEFSPDSSPFSHQRGTALKKSAVRRGSGRSKTLPAGSLSFDEMGVVRESPDEAEMAKSLSLPDNLDSTETLDEENLGNVVSIETGQDPSNKEIVEDENALCTEIAEESISIHVTTEVQEALKNQVTTVSDQQHKDNADMESDPNQNKPNVESDLGISVQEQRNVDKPELDAKKEDTSLTENETESKPAFRINDNLQFVIEISENVDNRTVQREEKCLLDTGTIRTDPESILDHLKETIIDDNDDDDYDEPLKDTEQDIFSSGSSPVKSGLEESDEEFLDAMSEWPKEVASVLARLDSRDHDYEDWDEEEAAAAVNQDDVIIPLSPPAASREAKMKLDGITTYSPSPPRHESFLPLESKSLTNYNASRESCGAYRDSGVDVQENENSPTHKPYRNGPQDGPSPDSFPNGQAGNRDITGLVPNGPVTTARCDSSPDILESIKPSPPVQPSSSVHSAKRSVPSYVINITGPFTERVANKGQGRTKLWHRLYAETNHHGNMVPLASEEDISAELAVDFSSAAYVDNSRETNV
ncbi:protein unc-80 homolog isoform X2 [Nematostella vectensis]|uniref:protein unc-80 homolog isoform X2 n=1 Tax=Nematostella vectensis TaxID=45351 RepID=UPI0020777DDC|nr:protein unc-80 homolog isoform X2 [Nematostella vectensis]